MQHVAGGILCSTVKLFFQTKKPKLRKGQGALKFASPLTSIISFWSERCPLRRPAVCRQDSPSKSSPKKERSLAGELCSYTLHPDPLVSTSRTS